MSRFLRILRVAICLGIFFLILEFVGGREVLASLLRVDLAYVAGALVLVVVDALLRSLNWLQLLKAFRELRYLQTASIYLAGGFYGSLLPSTVGKDTARAVTVSRRAGIDLRVSAASLITLNSLGLGAVAALGLVATALLAMRGPTAFLEVNLAVCAALALAVFALLFTPLGARLVGIVAKVCSFWPAASRLLKPLLDALLVLPARARARGAIATVAFINQIIRVSVAVLLARALGLDITWWVLAAIAPLVAIVEMVPLSFLGIGIGQGAMVYLLSHFDVAAADAFSLSTLVASIYIAQALIGGLPLLAESAFGMRSERPAG